MAIGTSQRPWARARVLAHETWKYFLVSIVALAADYALLILLTALGHVHYLVSAAVGFSVGLLINYSLSVTLVFQERRLGDRRLEFLVFFAIGLIGLLLNEILMKVFVDSFGLGYAMAKAPATAVGFVFNFGLRRVALFSNARSSGARGAAPSMPPAPGDLEEAVP
jgi:putative flippase GtrA